MDQLILKRASASRLSGEWDDDDYDVLAEAIVVGRIMKAAAAAPALILESSPGELAAEPCSGACREAIELYFSTPPERWRAPRALTLKEELLRQ